MKEVRQVTEEHPYIKVAHFSVSYDMPLIPSWMIDVSNMLEHCPNDASKLSRALHVNTQYGPSWVYKRGERPLSAYVYLVGNQVEADFTEMILELGLIGKGGEGKLHDFLNQNGIQRVLAGVQRSGHFVEGRKGPLLLLDRFEGANPTLDGVDGLLIRSLISANILPLTTDGFGIVPQTLDTR